MFSARLRQARQNCGLTQVELAKKLGIGKDLYNKYEKTNIRPNFETIRRISEILNVSIDYLLGSTDIPTPRNDPSALLDTGKEKEKAFIMGFQGNSREVIEMTKEEFQEMKSILDAIRKNRNG